VLAAAVSGAGGGEAGAGVSAPCRVPEVFLTFENDLVRTERLVERAAPVRILLLGPHLDREAALTRKRHKLEVELSRRLPEIRFTILADGGEHGLARDDVQRMRTAIQRLEPDLVIWQVGTGDALAATDPEDFSRTLEQAADWLRGQNIDLVLVDPPFVPHVGHENLYGRIVNEIIADRDRTNVVQQYGATTYLSTRPGSPPGAPGEVGRACRPELIAEAIVRAVTR